MLNYQCETCSRSFKRREHLINHNKKKNRCQQGLDIIPPEHHQNHQNIDNPPPKTTSNIINFIKEPMPTEIDISSTIILKEPMLIEQINLSIKEHIPTEVNINSINDPIPIETNALPNKEIISMEKNHKCYYCNKCFVRKDVMNKHMKLSCKVYKQQNKDKQEIFEKLQLLESKNEQLANENKTIINNAKTILTKNQQLEDDMKILKEEIKNLQPITIKNNNINNINNGIINNTNIIMVSHGQEDISKFCEKLLLSACKRGYNSVPQLVESMHFNPDYPEFHNVYIPDLKNKNAMVFDNNIWVLKNKDEVVKEIYVSKKDIIINNMEAKKNLLNEGQHKTLKKWLDSDKNQNKDIKDKKSIEYVYDNLKLLLYNLKHIPIETKGKLVVQKKQQLAIL